jgi:hypothetical protein
MSACLIEVSHHHLWCACRLSNVVLLQANMAAFRVLPSRSAAVRSYTESHVLEALNGHIATVAASGFLFFGSSVLMSNKVSLA